MSATDDSAVDAQADARARVDAQLRRIAGLSERVTGILDAPIAAPAPQRKYRLWVEPLDDRIVVRRLEDQNEGVEEFLALPDQAAKERPQVAEVLAIGPGRRNAYTGERMPLELAVGDQVLHGMYAGTEITVEGKTFLMLREEEVLGRFRREEIEGEAAAEQAGAPAESDYGRGLIPDEGYEFGPDRNIRSARCVDVTHGAEYVPAAQLAHGPHGLLPYCDKHALLYQGAMQHLGHVVTLEPIEQPSEPAAPTQE